MARDIQEIIWQKFVTSICSSGAAKGLSPSEVMPTSGLSPANWEAMDITGLPKPSDAPKPGTLDVAGLMQWANVMPNWSPTYTPSSLNFYDQYSAFLNSIALKGGNAALQQIADGYAVNVDTARKKLSADQLAALQQWATFNAAQASIPASAQASFQQWYNDNWTSTIVADQNNLAAQVTKLNQAVAAVGGPDYKTVSGAQTQCALNPTAGNALTGQGGGAFPAYAVPSGLNDWYLSAMQTLSDGSAPQIDFTIALDDSDSAALATNNYFNAAAGVSYGGFCWGGSAAASYSQSQGAQQYDSLVQGLKLRYTAQAAQIFQFNVGGWYNSAMLSLFSDQISAGSALANKPLFGYRGVLNLRTAQVLVVLKPSITLTGNKQTIATLNTQFNQQSAASFSVGGFCWSASASASQGSSRYAADSKVSTDGTAISITDNTNAPKVLLVVPSKLG